MTTSGTLAYGLTLAALVEMTVPVRVLDCVASSGFKDQDDLAFNQLSFLHSTVTTFPGMLAETVPTFLSGHLTDEVAQSQLREFGGQNSGPRGRLAVPSPKFDFIFR